MKSAINHSPEGKCILPLAKLKLQHKWSLQQCLVCPYSPGSESRLIRVQ
jgi:hypothetical protein